MIRRLMITKFCWIRPQDRRGAENSCRGRTSEARDGGGEGVGAAANSTGASSSSRRDYRAGKDRGEEKGRGGEDRS